MRDRCRNLLQLAIELVSDMIGSFRLRRVVDDLTPENAMSYAAPRNRALVHDAENLSGLS